MRNAENGASSIPTSFASSSRPQLGAEINHRFNRFRRSRLLVQGSGVKCGGAWARSWGGCCARGRPGLLWSAARVGSGSAT